MWTALSRIAAVAGISALVVGGCGGGGGKGSPAKSSKSNPSAVDLSTLDTGKYSTKPRNLGQVASDEEGRMAEAMRMAEAVADPASFDASLVDLFGAPYVRPSDVAEEMSDTGEAIVEPVLTKHKMICAYVFAAKNYKPKQQAANPKAVYLTLLRFPDQTSASDAAVEMDATDFAVSPQNVAVSVTKYPNAHSHWRPGIPSMASTLAHRDFVIHVYAGDSTAGIETLTGMVENTYDAEIAALDGFEPTAVSQIAKLPKDPDRLLGRTIELTPGTEPPLSARFARYGPNGAKTFQDERQVKDKVYEDAGVDRMAVWTDGKLGGSQIWRARDRDAAIKLVKDLAATDDALDQPINGVPGLADAKCFAQKQEAFDHAPGFRFFCYLSSDRYVAGIAGADEADLRQRAAAQYALLVNPL